MDVGVGFRLAIPTWQERHADYWAPVLTMLNYDPANPWTVWLSLRHRDGSWVDWMFHRDLLIAGLSAPAGTGAVTVRPVDRDTVRLTLSGVGGSARFNLRRRAVADAVDRMLTLVPPGEEHIDWPRELTMLTTQTGNTDPSAAEG